MKARTRNAFTIVELMIAIALMLMLMGVAVFIFVQAVKIFTKTSAEAQIYQSAQVAMDMIRKEIRGTKPLLTPNGVPNNQQFIVQFDDPVTGPDGKPWRFDRITFKTTTTDPDTDQPSTRWVLYWVQGGDKAGGRTGTLMKYVSPALDIPPDPTGIANIDDTPPSAPGLWGTGWHTDSAEICQNVSFFGVEIFWDPDADTNTIGRFFANAADILGYPTFDALFAPYVASGSPSYLRLDSYDTATSGFDVSASTVKLPSQVRVTLRVRDPKENQERTIQEQIWIPVAD